MLGLHAVLWVLLNKCVIESSRLAGCFSSEYFAVWTYMSFLYSLRFTLLSFLPPVLPLPILERVKTLPSALCIWFPSPHSPFLVPTSLPTLAPSRVTIPGTVPWLFPPLQQTKASSLLVLLFMLVCCRTTSVGKNPIIHSSLQFSLVHSMVSWIKQKQANNKTTSETFFGPVNDKRSIFQPPSLTPRLPGCFFLNGYASGGWHV